MEHKLKQIRISNRMTLSALASQVGCTKSTLSRIENWVSDPSTPLILRLCKIFPSLQPNDFFKSIPDLQDGDVSNAS